MKSLKKYYNQALFDGIKAMATNDAELKRLYKQKQQIETAHKANVQKYRMDLQDVNEKIEARKAALKAEKAK